MADGILDAGKYIQELEEGDYQGILSLEITDGRYFMDPEASIRQSAEKLFDLLK